MITTSSAFKEIPWEDNTTVLLNIPRNRTMPQRPDFVLNWDLSEFQNIFKQLCRSLVNVHRDMCVLDDLSQILELLHDSVEKMKIECYRVGAIPKGTKVKIPSSANISSKFSLQQIAVAIRSLGSLFLSMTKFVEKYKSEPFDLSCYLNMNRIAKAERLLDQAQQKMQQLLRFSYALRFQSIGQVFVCAVRWVRRVRGRQNNENTLSFYDQDLIPAKKSTPKLDEIGSPDESFREGLFTKTHEDQPPTLWPVSPISSFQIDVSLNASIGSFVSQIPKTLFTPNDIEGSQTKSPKRKKKK